MGLISGSSAMIWLALSSQYCSSLTSGLLPDSAYCRARALSSSHGVSGCHACRVRDGASQNSPLRWHLRQTGNVSSHLTRLFLHGRHPRRLRSLFRSSWCWSGFEGIVLLAQGSGTTSDLPRSLETGTGANRTRKRLVVQADIVAMLDAGQFLRREY